MFQLINTATGEPVNDVVYTSAVEATAAIGQYPGVKLRIGRLVNDTWKLREHNRFVTGEYEQLPEFVQFYTKTEHYAHVSKKDPAKIAFTASPEDGMADRQTAITVATYLTRYAADLLPHEARDISSRYEARLMVNDNTLVISHERSAFRFAYNEQPVKSESSDHISCMARSARYYTNSMNLHPAEAYSTDKDGLHIAYTVDPNHPNSVTARAVVWPKDNLFVRVYGLTDQYRTALKALLESRGYKRDITFVGAPLARIPADYRTTPESEDGTFLMPYIDGEDRGINDHPYAKRFFVCGSCDGDYVADETGGTICVGNAASYHTCENCESRIHQDDDYHTVNGDETWCNSCYESSTFTCERFGEAFSDDIANFSVNRRCRSWTNGNWRYFTETWCEDAADRFAFYCANTEEYYALSDYEAIDVVVNSRGHTEVWCAEKTEEQWFQCDDCEKYFVKEMMAPDQPNGEKRCNDCHEANVADLEGRGYPMPTFTKDERQTELELVVAEWEPLF